MRFKTAVALAAALCGAVFAQQPGAAPLLKIGDVAPNFTLGSTKGGKVTLADYKGKQPVVLAFFPAAFTGGWTKEFTAYQAGIAKFNGNNTVVFGISTDNTPSQKVFADQLNMSFAFLSDFSNREVAKAYGVLRPDGMCNRVTYVVDMEGKIGFVDDKTAIDPLAVDEACSRLAHRTK